MSTRKCEACGADFSENSVWKVQAGSSPTAQGASIFARLFLACASIVLLLPGLLFGMANHITSWVLLSLGGLLTIVLVAATARAPWMALVLLGSALLGLTSCSHTFHWG